MNFGFTAEQELLRGEVRKFVSQRCPMAAVRKLIEAPTATFPAELWGEWVAMGMHGLTLPEAYGGAGLSSLELSLVLEELGRGLLPLPVTSTALAASLLCELASPEQKARLLPRLAQGAVATCALLERDPCLEPGGVNLNGVPTSQGFRLSGQKQFVEHAGAAEIFIVAFRSGEALNALSLAVLERGEGVLGQSFLTMDRTKPVGTLTLEAAEVSEANLLGKAHAAWPALRRLYDLGALFVAAEALGAAQALHAMTVEYAKTRVQFGHPIGHYQGVKHPLAEMYVDLESARSLIYYAAWLADHEPGALSLATSRAKAYISEAFTRIGTEAIQLHGAIGYTEEYPAQLYMKRARYVRPAFGDADYHYERVMTLSGGAD